MSKKDNYVGFNGFIWAYGVVESRIDPMFLGRCKVRYISHYAETQNEVSTEELPWTYPMIPINQENSVGPKEGDVVISFFADGAEMRYPVMIGMLPGVPEEPAEFHLSEEDFLIRTIRSYFDVRTDELLHNPEAEELKEKHLVPREPEEVCYHDDGRPTEIWEQEERSRYPDPVFLEEPTLDRYARGDLGFYEGLRPRRLKVEGEIEDGRRELEDPGGFLEAVVLDDERKEADFLKGHPDMRNQALIQFTLEIMPILLALSNKT